MMNWFKFDPIDTLFFKGAEPMIMGENHTASYLFPPLAQTISGAVRTAILIQNNIEFDDYAKGNVSKDLTEAIGKAGETAPFTITGPLFMMDEEIFVPAPYTWFMEKTTAERKRDDCPVKTFKSKPLSTSLIKNGFPEMYWAKGDIGELVSLGGMWISLSDFYSGNDMIHIKQKDDLFVSEKRTGIALHKNRKVRDGHLYSFNHIRLKKDVSIIFGIDKNLPQFADQGVLKLGGEQRFGSYAKLKSTINIKEDDGLFMALSPIEGTEEVNETAIATGKILYIGGWDMHKGFHKPMKGFFPAGTVCRKKINSNFITIQGEQPC